MSYQVTVVFDVAPERIRLHSYSRHRVTAGALEDAIENETVTLFELVENANIVDVSVREHNAESDSGQDLPKGSSL